MNKYIFYILILGLALGITLGAVYYLNLKNMNQSMSEISDKKIENQVSVPDTKPAEIQVGEIIIDENTPKNYKNEELINLEKEINSLDLSSENDIE